MPARLMRAHPSVQAYSSFGRLRGAFLSWLRDHVDRARTQQSSGRVTGRDAPCHEATHAAVDYNRQGPDIRAIFRKNGDMQRQAGSGRRPRINRRRCSIGCQRLTRRTYCRPSNAYAGSACHSLALKALHSTAAHSLKLSPYACSFASLTMWSTKTRTFAGSSLRLE